MHKVIIRACTLLHNYTTFMGETANEIPINEDDSIGCCMDPHWQNDCHDDPMQRDHRAVRARASSMSKMRDRVTSDLADAGMLRRGKVPGDYE